MNVSAIIVTRGDVDLTPVLESLPNEWEKIVWINGQRLDLYDAIGASNDLRHILPAFPEKWPDLSVYGRYAAIEHASYDLIYVQDDDVIVSDPQAIIERDPTPEQFLCANMPQEFRPHYPDSCLVGFGACFHRDAPKRAFERFYDAHTSLEVEDLISGEHPKYMPEGFLFRTCDVVFTALTPRMLVDVPITHREFASGPDRMWKQPGHVEERARMLELARQVRDA